MSSNTMKATSNPEHKSSSLLSKDENDRLFKMLGHKCQTLSTTVVQLFSTDGPDGIQWIKRDAGILCLVRDPNRRSYFFRLFCLTRGQLIWEHEIYNSMQYNSPRSFLHTFEAEECVVAFNFANEGEAAHMRNALYEKLKAKEEKRMERRARGTSGSRNSLKAAPAKPSTISTNTVSNGLTTSQPTIIPSPIMITPNSSSKRSKRRTSKITKADIGRPQDFRHVSHVGWDPNTGFDVNNVDDPELQELFQKAGVSESHLKDRSTREFIYDFIERHGGIDAVKEENVHQPKSSNQNRTPPIPVRSVPPTPSSIRSAPPPPPPSKSPRINAAPPPPPPPPIQTIPTRIHDTSVSRPAPCISASSNIPPAPPPPPPPPVVSPIEEKIERIPTSNNNNNGSSDHRSALMDAIRSGTTLKHVDSDSKKDTDSSANNRGELMNQIRQGVELRTVQRPVKNQTSAPLDGLAGALARALAERSKAINGDESSTSESDDDDYDDEEWEE